MQKTPRAGSGPTRTASLGRAASLTFGVLLVSMTLVETAVGQSASGGQTLRSILSQPADSSASVQDRLDALIETTKRARAERELDKTNESPQASDGPARASSGLAAAPASRYQAIGSDTSGEVNQDSARSMSEIRERLRILQRLRRSSQMSERAADLMAKELAPEALLNNPTMPVPVNTAPGTLQMGSTDLPQPTLSAIEENLTRPLPEDQTDPVAEASTSVAAERILPTPVNSIALGESLYRTGNYESALKALLSADTTGLSQSDRTWLDLIVSLCQRKMGDFENAAGTLREIANEKSTDYPVQAAKWWLKHAEATHGSRVKLNSLTAGLDSLLERSRSHVER